MEDVLIDNFNDFQLNIINNLLKEDYLYIDPNNYVKIKKDIMIFLIGELHRNGVISYWHYPKNIRNTIDGMIDESLLFFENTLFTKQELSYFNFYLNKKEFTNGLDLRNKYLHGTNTNFDEEQKNEYYILLKLIILVLLKIEDDLRIRNYLLKGELN